MFPVKKYQLFALSLILLLVSISLTKCKEQKEIWKALFAACGEYTAFLNPWWQDLQDMSQFETDPLGGFLFIYWIDEDCNVCHGEPGVDGQLGPVVVSASHPDVYTLAQNSTVINENDVKIYQTISFNLNGYSASGFHFVQFDNVYWWLREDKYVFGNKGAHFFSTPAIVSLDYEFCLAPVYAFNDEECRYLNAYFLPNFNQEEGQHPTKCLAKMYPVELDMPKESRLQYCVLKCEHGTDIYDLSK